jgi:hypothetical protein
VVADRVDWRPAGEAAGGGQVQPKAVHVARLASKMSRPVSQPASDSASTHQSNSCSTPTMMMAPCTFWLMLVKTGVIHSRVIRMVMPVAKLASGVLALRAGRGHGAGGQCAVGG